MIALPPLSPERRQAVLAALPAMALVMLAAPIVLARLHEAGVPPVLAAGLTVALLAGLAVNAAGYSFAWLSQRDFTPTDAG